MDAHCPCHIVESDSFGNFTQIKQKIKTKWQDSVESGGYTSHVALDSPILLFWTSKFYVRNLYGSLNLLKPINLEDIRSHKVSRGRVSIAGPTLEIPNLDHASAAKHVQIAYMPSLVMIIYQGLCMHIRTALCKHWSSTPAVLRQAGHHSVMPIVSQLLARKVHGYINEVTCDVACCVVLLTS